jgi:hypothetical protein
MGFKAAGGRKNLIINGGMQVAQRGTSATGVGNGDNGYHTCDRWQFVESGSSSGVYTLSQETDAPDGFGNSMKFDCTTTESTLAANEMLRLRYNIEGQDLQQLKKGTTSSESVTLSFWVKSYQTGTFVINLYGASRHIAATYTVDSSATWEKKTITFNGDTAGVIPNDSNTGLALWFLLQAGTQFTSGTLPTSWSVYNENNLAVGQTVNLADSTANYLNITGVQLELGSTATDFEHRSYGEELALCQRYYHKVGGSLSYSALLTGASSMGSTEIVGFVYHPVEMRVNPSFSLDNIPNMEFRKDNDTSFTLQAYTPSNTSSTTKAAQVWFGNQSTVGTGYSGFIRVKNGVTASISFDAEL